MVDQASTSPGPTVSTRVCATTRNLHVECDESLDDNQQAVEAIGFAEKDAARNLTFYG